MTADAQPQWLTPTERRAWLALLAVVELLPGTMDQQLRRESGLTHFDYQTLAMLSETPGRTLRMTQLAERTNATLPRLSHVVTRLGDRGLVRRVSCPQDGRATNVELTDTGWDVIVAAAPGHVARARSAVFDALDETQVGQLADISEAVLRLLDPEGRMSTDPAAQTRSPAE